jgi:hypothetical protein
VGSYDTWCRSGPQVNLEGSGSLAEPPQQMPMLDVTPAPEAEPVRHVRDDPKVDVGEGPRIGGDGRGAPSSDDDTTRPLPSSSANWRRGNGAMTQEVDSPVEHSAVVALHRLFHPEREGNPVSELMRQALAFIDCWNAELNEREEAAAPSPTRQDDYTDKVVISLCFDRRVLTRIDADAKRLGISRTAWLHIAAGERLEDRR